MVRLDMDELSEICADFSGKNFYIAELISPDLLVNARSSLKIPYADRLVAFLDLSLFKSFKMGCAIGLSGFYWNVWSGGAGSLSWDELVRVGFKKQWKNYIKLGTGVLLPVGGYFGEMKRDDYFLLLMRIRELVRARMNSDHAAIPRNRPARNEWWLAVAGQRYGPYGEDVLKMMAESGQIHPEKAAVWKKGMTSWMPLAQMPELASAYASSGPAAADKYLVDINKANRDELVEVLGLQTEDAERIIKQREAIGGFVSAEQIGELLGMKPHQVHRLSKLVRFSHRRDQPVRGRVVDY